MSNALFPMIWPTPYAMTTQLYLGTEKTGLQLPVIPYRTPEHPGFRAPEPREERADAKELSGKGWPYQYRVTHDLLNDRTSVEWKAEERFSIRDAHYLIADSTTYDTANKNPADSGFLGESERVIQLKDRTITLKTRVSLRSDEKNFHVVFTRRLWKNGKPVREKQWKETIPRDFQ